jgi:hypothetical protein
MSLRTVIVRTGKPSQFDQFEYGTLCRVENHHHNDYELYLQVGKDEEHPQWELLGLFNSDSPQQYIDELVSLRLKKKQV